MTTTKSKETATELKNTGLAGLKVGPGKVSKVDPILGVQYKGIPVKNIIDNKVSPEAVIDLILEEKVPSKDKNISDAQILEMRRLMEKEFETALRVTLRLSLPDKVGEQRKALIALNEITQNLSQVKDSLKKQFYQSTESEEGLFQSKVEQLSAQIDLLNKKNADLAHLTSRLNNLGDLFSATDPVGMFIASLLQLHTLNADNSEWTLFHAKKIMAVLPVLVGAIIAKSHGWQPLYELPADEKAGYIETMIHVMNPPGSINKEKLLKVLKAHFILHMDHGGGNASVFTAKVAASAGTSMERALIGGSTILAGSKHGGACENVANFLKQLPETIDFTASEKETKKQLKAYLSELIVDPKTGLKLKGARLAGFGHRVLRDRDSRAVAFFDIGNDIFKNEVLYKKANLYRQVGTEILSEICALSPGSINDPYENVDIIAPIMLNLAGLNKPGVPVLLFAFSRCAGWLANTLHEQVDRVPIYRPSFPYMGPDLMPEFTKEFKVKK